MIEKFDFFRNLQLEEALKKKSIPEQMDALWFLFDSYQNELIQKDSELARENRIDNSFEIQDKINEIRHALYDIEGYI